MTNREIQCFSCLDTEVTVGADDPTQVSQNLRRDNPERGVRVRKYSFETSARYLGNDFDGVANCQQQNRVPKEDTHPLDSLELSRGQGLELVT